MVKNKFYKVSQRESILINENTDFLNFSVNSLQGSVLIFSIGYIVSLPFVGKYITIKIIIAFHFKFKSALPNSEMDNLISPGLASRSSAAR